MNTFDPKHRYSDAAKLARLKNKKLFLFDIDGTIAVGDTLYEGSADLIRYINAIGGRAYYITNNSTKSGLDYVKKFHDAFHLDSTEDQFITSGYMTLRFLKENYAEKKIFVLGTASFIAELRKNGLHVTEVCEENIDCVVVAYDSELNYGKLTEVCKVLFTQDVPFYGTNPDLRCPIDFGFIPDCGAICDMITATTDMQPIYLGKPSKEVVNLCLDISGFTPEETLVVGDRLYTDIACGINGGVDTCVLFTGEAQKKDILTPEGEPNTQYLPDYAFENVQERLDASNGFLHDTDSQRIRSGVYADGSTDLEDGNGVYVVFLLLQSAYQSVSELHGFFLIISVSYADTVICYICFLLCQICQQQVDGLVHGLAAASADTGRKYLAFF